MDDILQIISTVGFPIACAVAVGFAMWKFFLKNAEREEQRENNYIETISRFSAAFENNNVILKEMSERIGRLEDGK